MKKSLLMAILLSLIVTSLKAQVILQDSFGYADGVTTTVSGGLWARHSGTANDSFVKNGQLQVFGTRADDINRGFTNTAGTVLYTSFLIDATNLVSNSTNYFAHFKDNGTSNFRCRLYSVAGAAVGAPNAWRLGIANAAGANSTSTKVYPLDLATNVFYRVFMSYDTANFVSTLWIDPVVASDENAVPADGTTLLTITTFAFRQSGSTIQPNFLIDDLYVGNSFGDVAVGTPKPATIYYQPTAGPTTNFVGGSMTLSCVAGGAGTVSFQWQHAGTNLMDDANTVGSNSNLLALVNAQTNQSGNYQCIVTSTTNSVFASSATTTVAQVVITAAPVPPSFITQPVSQTVYTGANVFFSTTVSSPGNVTYQWYSNNVLIAGANASTLELDHVQTNAAASYKVAVSNDVVVNGVISTNGVLTVTNAPIVTIGFLRTLVDPTTFVPTPPLTQPFQVTGIVTTTTNTTTGNTSSYFLQDGTGGLNIFVTFGSDFRPALGDVVTFVGVLSSFTSGLELVADTNARPYSSYVILSNNIAGLPAPKAIPFALTNTFGYTYVNTNFAGSLVTLSNVYFGVSAGTTISTSGNVTVTVTNAAGTNFNLSFFSLDQDTAGQVLPDFAKSVTGVLYGFHPNYSVAVTRFSDIVTNVPVVPSIPLTFTVSSGTNFTFNWTDPSFFLQSATNVAGPYTTITGATDGFITNSTPDQPAVFYRLIHP